MQDSLSTLFSSQTTEAMVLQNSQAIGGLSTFTWSSCSLQMSADCAVTAALQRHRLTS